MSKAGRQTSQATRSAQTLRTLRHIRERDGRQASALSEGSVEMWRRAWGYKSISGTQSRLRQLQHAGLIWTDCEGIWRREEDA